MNSMQNQTGAHKPYRTEKLTFAAYLVATGKAGLQGTEPNGQSKNVLFVLSHEPSQDEITAFFSGAAQVSALRFAEAISTLKSAAYEARRVRR